MTSSMRHREGRPMKIVIFFRDVTGKKYVTVVKSGNGFAAISQPSMSYSLIREFKYRIAYPAISYLSIGINNMRRRYVMKYHPTFFTPRAANREKDKA
ncbi:MAG: hypothetical protein NVS3B29_00680 [Candidatus Saccharimonadales bacterium]